MDKYLMFPLYSLQFSKDYKITMEHIIRYGIVEYGRILYETIKLTKSNRNSIYKYAFKKLMFGVKNECDEGLFQFLAYKKLECSFAEPEYTEVCHYKLNQFVNKYERKFGKDIIVSVPLKLLFEVRDGKFDFELFRILCAILVRLGKKPFLRISYLDISYNMLGFKGKIPYLNSTSIYPSLLQNQIKNRVIKLKQKVVNNITYRNRLIFYPQDLKVIILLNE